MAPVSLSALSVSLQLVASASPVPALAPLAKEQSILVPNAMELLTESFSTDRTVLNSVQLALSLLPSQPTNFHVLSVLIKQAVKFVTIQTLKSV